MSEEHVLSILTGAYPDEEDREAAFQSLHVPEAVPALIKVLRDPDQQFAIRAEAARALGEIGSPQAKKAIVEMLVREDRSRLTSFDPVCPFLWALGDGLNACMAGESNKELLVDLRDKSHSVRSCSADLLGERRSKEAVPELIRLLDDEHPHVRKRATAALRDIGDPRGIEELIAIVEKRRGGGNRATAIGALGKIRSPRCLQTLWSIAPEDPQYRNVMSTPPMLAHKLKGSLDSFVLALKWCRGSEKAAPSYPSLYLSVKGTGGPAGWKSARISRDQAARIVDHLLQDGYFDAADNYHGRRYRPGSSASNRYCMTISVEDGPLLGRTSRWNLSYIRRLDSLRWVLEGDAAKAMDELLRALQDQRHQWEQGAPQRDLPDPGKSPIW